MTNEHKPELSPEELEKASGGFSASKKRPRNQIGGLSEDELRRAAGAGIPLAQHQFNDGVESNRTRDRNQGGGINPAR